MAWIERMAVGCNSGDGDECKASAVHGQRQSQIALSYASRLRKMVRKAIAHS